MSVTTREMLSRWLDQLYGNKNLTHMIVVCDTFDYDDYPVYISSDEDVKEKEAEYAGKNMQKVMEVYSRNHTREEQLAERRAFHYD